MSLQLDVTLNYGFCSNDLTITTKERNTTFNYDNYHYIPESGYSPFDFDIYQIIFSETNEYIESLKIIYKNRKTGKLMLLLETPQQEKTEHIQTIEFKKFEKIINVKIWLKDEKLIGFEMKTSSNRSIKIGYGKNGEEITIPEFENDRKIILGIGVYATKKRVTSIYFYFIDKEEYLKIFDPCLLELRAKLKLNEQFKKNIEERKNELNEKNKLLVDVCELPEAAFFCIAPYFSYH